jgi:phage baseplate assembly protein W
MPVAISLPMRVDDYGRVVATYATERIWADRVRSVIATTAGERVMRPEYGSRIPQGLLEEIPEMPDLIEDAVKVAFTRWLPDLRLDAVLLIEEDEEFGEVTMEVVYSIPNGRESQVLSLPYGSAEVNV